jgi:hypothetical protein
MFNKAGGKQVAESRYEKYVVRRPNVLKDGLEVPIEKIVWREERPSTGPNVIMSRDLIKDSDAVIEFGLIWRDCVAGNGKPGNFNPHKHDAFDEIFCFLGTDYQNPHDLGAEAEFWLGEGKELDRVTIRTTATVYVPAGLAHFPLIWKNVKRPAMFVVVICSGLERKDYWTKVVPISMEGRPM